MGTRPLIALVALLLAAGCYDSTQSRPRANNGVRTHAVDVNENGSSHEDTHVIEAGKDTKINPKTGKP